MENKLPKNSAILANSILKFLQDCENKSTNISVKKEDKGDIKNENKQ